MSFRVIRDIVSDTINATSGDDVVQQVTLTGAIATNPATTADLTLTRIGDIVAVKIPDITKSSADATATLVLTALPAIYRPLADVVIPVSITQNATRQIGIATVASASGVITISLATGGNFTSSQAVHLYPSSLVYIGA